MYSVEVGDVFNETDEDVDQRVTSVHAKSDPPTAMCCSIKAEDQSEETEQEYDLEYVDKCVQARKEFRQHGYHDLDVKGIYKMKKEALMEALMLAKQSPQGLKQEL